jgi:hypothetical protein
VPTLVSGALVILVVQSSIFASRFASDALVHPEVDTWTPNVLNISLTDF